MYAKVYQYKFPGISEAKVAAAFCSDYLGQKIDEHNFHGELNKNYPTHSCLY